MDSIWGDPWADNPKPKLPGPEKNDPVEVTTCEPVKPRTTLFSGGFEDEAGWGNFEESTGFDTDGADGADRNQELGWATSQGHEDEKDSTDRLAPEPPFKHTNASGILSPGWGDTHTLQLTQEPLQNNKQNDDSPEIPHSPAWESSRLSISSIPYAPGFLDSNYTDLGMQSTKLDEHSVSASLPRPSTSSTTKTVVSTDSNAFSDIQPSPTHHDGSRWERRPSNSDATDVSNNSLDSVRTSFEEAYVPSKQIGDSDFYTGKVEELSAMSTGSSRNIVPAEEAHKSMQEEQPHDGTDLDNLQAVVKGPRFSTNFNLVQDIFKAPIRSENHEQANDEVIDSTSTRKAWYRLTRPQTMREFNTGATDDSYVRVSWPKSHIRTETLKVATRWASEDRFNGHVVLGGKPGAATFGWDIPSDGSIIPPRPMSMIISSLPQREGSGKHLASHHRQSSMPHSSSRTNPSPVAQFGWSTSPTSSGDGVIASLGDVLESRAIPTAFEQHAPHGKQRQAEQVSVTAAAQSALPIASSLKEITTVSQSQPRPEKKQGLDLPGLSKLDTTEVTLNATLVDDDEWGEMVKSPSEPLSPMVLPYFSASAVEKNPSGIDEHVPIISTHRRPTPITAPPVAQSFPEHMLSPARQAALEAATATRFIKSQPTQSGSPTIRDNESRSSAIVSIKSAAGVIPVAPSSLLEADLSFFETPPQQPLSPNPSREVDASVQLSTKEEEHAQSIVRKIPDLSFMLR
ncbi:hypothetical protein BLS_005616 [Venturia inaequalis]|uniref:Uncharacterized protein n=1 Tax=Venturia inaequalis TaxID=5025 RepID=A0A8H3ZG84_VENIN|nr:hypothetical protein BLS_005616 [Venturia inaequalis]KAE9976685.1 hypothetical protein EG328_002471 [Venturia inaequalis]KAE9992142.1 hypothetical protein EG327_009977 [Venturia inaequalis]RDI84884.1 hypothetical protein Vi05172_g5011 [Venturia inaequalis]